MTRLLDERIFVSYSQAYVMSTEDLPRLDECFRGQQNGLCGASFPGFLFLITGLHTGRVNMTIDALATEPPLDDSWEEIVEVSFMVSPMRTGLSEWGGHGWYPLPLKQGTYRVRYCANNMQAGKDRDTTPLHEPSIDSYYLAFWPGAAAADRLIKQTSGIAAYWHDFARNLGPKQPPGTA